MIERLRDYITARLALIRLDIIEKTSKGVTFLFVGVILSTLFLMFLLMFSVAIALLLGKNFGSWAVGFGLVAAFYLFLFLLVIILRKPLIEKPILNNTIKYLYEKSDGDNDEDDEDEK